MNPKFQSEYAFSDVELICEEAEIDEKKALFGEHKLMNVLLKAQAGQCLQTIKKAIMQYGDFN